MSLPWQLRLVSYLAPNMFWFYQAIAAYLGRRLAVETEISQAEFDPLEDPLLLHDQLDLAFICGLPFIRYHCCYPQQLQAIAAPVMQAARYHNRPIYFSDVVVPAASDITSFVELAGKTLCYNDLGSNSGYNLVRQKLKQDGYSTDFFGQVLASGSHQRSMRWVVEGLADCAAIDSTVLEQELQSFPELSEGLRVIESLGPCPIPPIVGSQHLGTDLLGQLQAALLQPDPELQLAMQQAQIQAYVAVKSADYEAIALQYEAALQAGYEVINSASVSSANLLK
ncbi:MAG: PhnD/SsuA/transferrin family substrate-binding protein [Trichocoleus desertorum ATA4-8-CV12]|nr:PhnD/SsuA/transferrin family substrate-binding protein [Trichocoleus desertorum ATA4-8-CV12]